VKTLHDHCILGGDAIAERLRTISGRNAGGVEQVFASPRYAVQWPAIVAGSDLGVGLLGLRELGIQVRAVGVQVVSEEYALSGVLQVGTFDKNGVELIERGLQSRCPIMHVLFHVPAKCEH